MNEFNRDARAQAFDKLPKEIKSFLMSDQIVSNFQDIGKLHGLNIEKTGALADTVNLVLLGLISPGEFTHTVQDALNTDESKALAIAETTEKTIFSKVRESLQKNTKTEETKKNPESTQKEDILAEIENPTPVQPPISSAGVVIPKTPQPQTVAHEFIAGKMNEPVSLPAQKYNADPYREPLA